MREVPVCPYCGEIMIPSYAIAYKEYICVPCGFAVEYHNDLEKKEVSKEEIKALKKKYEKDLHKLAFEKGKAICKFCLKSGGNNCEVCNIDYDYIYWESRPYWKR